MTRSLRFLALGTLFSLPTVGLAEDSLDLVDASFDDNYEDFSAPRDVLDSREARKKSDSQRTVDASLSSFDEDPEWDIPEDPDALIDEDPAWDDEPDLGALFDVPFVEEDEFVISQAPPATPVEDEYEDEAMVDLPEADDHIENAVPGLDLSIFDIED